MRMKHWGLMMIVLMITQASPVFADGPSDQYRDLWQWRLIAGASNGSNTYGYWYATIGVFPQATDGYDGESRIASWSIPTTYAAVFHDEESNGWNGAAGLYREDYVGPLASGQTKTWQIYVWSTPDMPADYEAASLVMNRMDAIALTNDFQFQLRLLSKPESVSGGPDVGTVWNLDSPTPDLQVSFPTYRTDNGLAGYHFELSATAAPEPSSLAVLAGGLLSCAFGFMRRRSCESPLQSH